MKFKPRRLHAVLAAGLLLLLAAAGGAWYWQRMQQDMPRLLRAFVTAQGAWDNPWDLQDRKIESLRQDLAGERNQGQRLIIKREIAQQYLNAGAPEPAIAALEALIQEYRGRLAPADVATLEGDLAFAFYRVGEQQNCSVNPDASVCLLPLDLDAVHRQKLGAEEAARRFQALLENPAVDPDSALLYRWLMNLSYMQLGKHPADVPKQWLMPSSLFASDGDVGRFRDVAAARGVIEAGRAGGTVLEDFDNDGHLDLLISHMGVADPMAYFRNDGKGQFVRATEGSGLEGLVGGLNMVQADFDNDGCIDVYVPRGAWYHDKGKFPSSLLRGHCDGTFEDVTLRAGVANGYPSQTAVWADFNNDGLLDLFVGNEIMRDKVAWPADTPNVRLYINQGNGRFKDVAAAAGLKVTGMVKGATSDDFDNDGRMDLYVSVMGGANRLYRNKGAGADGTPVFEDVTERAGVAEPIMSFTTWFFDYDNDGWPDIFVSGYWATMPNMVREMLGDKANAKGDRVRLYRNNHDGTFTDVAPRLNLDRLLLTMGANYGDLDNDGWLDFYAGTGAAPLNNVVPNQMFRNDGGRRFQNVTTSGGFGHLQKGHAVAFGDVDGDGQQDIFANIGGAMRGDKFYSVLFKNPGHANHWIKLDAVGIKANRFAVGARVRVRVRSPDGAPRDIFRTIGSGGSFGASSLRLHVGVGMAEKVDEVEIRWPGSNVVQRFAGPIATNARYEMREGRSELRPLPADRKR